MAGLFESLLPGAVTAAAGVGMAKEMTDLGAQAASGMNTLGNQLQGDMAFTPYSVKTGVGTTNVAADGSVDMGGLGRNPELGGMSAANMAGAGDAFAQAAGMAGTTNEQLQGALGQLGASQQGMAGQMGGAYDASNQMMAASLQDPSARQNELFSQMQAAQAPALQRARSAMEQRAHAQGRSGVMGNQFGGSSEQFAQSKAEAEARNSAMLQANQLGMQEQMQQGQLASQYGQLGQGYAGQMAGAAGMQNQFGVQEAQLGQAGGGLLAQLAGQQGQLGLGQEQAAWNDFQHQLQASQLGATNANMAQTGQISGANMAGQLGLGGIQAEVNAGKAATELYGNMFGAMASPLASLGANLDENGIGGLWEQIKGIF